MSERIASFFDDKGFWIDDQLVVLSGGRAPSDWRRRLPGDSPIIVNPECGEPDIDTFRHVDDFDVDGQPLIYVHERALAGRGIAEIHAFPLLERRMWQRGWRNLFGEWAGIDPPLGR